MKLWDYDPDTLLPNLPSMITFPHLETFYSDWTADLRSKGVEIRTNTDVTAILSRSKTGVVLQTRPFDPERKKRVDELGGGEHTGPPSITETFDDMVLCILADDAKKLLGKTATWKEKFILGGATFFDDITITHSDSKYFQKNFETHFNPELCAKPKSKQQEDMIAFSKNERPGPGNEPPGFRPMYYTHSYPEDMHKIEMAFDVTNYQHQFRMDHDADKAPVPYENHVFQSIFLDKENRHLWTMDQIDESKIIEKKWWHQLGHRWQHYVRVVPNMMFINGKNRTLFAGSWTLVVGCLYYNDFLPTCTCECDVGCCISSYTPSVVARSPPPKLMSCLIFHHKWHCFVAVRFLDTTSFGGTSRLLGLVCLPDKHPLNAWHIAVFTQFWSNLLTIGIQNMHEMACVSGIAAAYRLGADYEVFDDLAEDLFKKYLLISHGVRYKRGKKTQ